MPATKRFYDAFYSEKVLHEDLQEEISQLKNEKASLQMALSESEIALADVRQELLLMKKSVSNMTLFRLTQYLMDSFTLAGQK